MKTHEALTQLCALPGPQVRESKLLETLEQARNSYYRAEENHSLSHLEFLLSQLRYTRKRWWALQALLLTLGSHILSQLEPEVHRIRSLGVLGCLFAVFLIPELWRNRSSDSTQVEAASLYSLRQVYAARLTLFGIVDVFLLTLFCLWLGSLSYSASQVTAHFLLPGTVTACLCFSFLCGSPALNETVSLALCLTFGGGWFVLVRNDSFYTALAPWVWMALLALALALLLLLVRKTLRTTNHTWEVDYYGITAH